MCLYVECGVRSVGGILSLTLSYDIVSRLPLLPWNDAGVMEFVPDTCSVDVLKKRHNTDSIARVFDVLFADNPFEAKKVRKDAPLPPLPSLAFGYLSIYIYIYMQWLV